MALETYVGTITDFSRKPFKTSEQLELRVVPLHASYGGHGLLSDKAIPVTVTASGQFTFDLETSDSVLPRGEFALEARWLIPGGGWSRWLTFRSRPGGGNVKDVVRLAPPPGSFVWGEGPPPSSLPAGVIYYDIQAVPPRTWFPEGSAIL